MTQTVSAAVATRETGPQALITQYTADFRQVLPDHIKPETFVRLSQGVLRRDPKLMRAANDDPGSFLAALLECARLGHEPGTTSFALVPLGGKVEGWEQYQGVIERIFRAGAVRNVKAEVVRVNDHYTYDRRTTPVPDHRFDDFAGEDERGDLRGVYAYAEMVDGSFSRVVTMSRDVVMKHKAMSKGASGADSPWKKWEDTMWLKCAVHELEKWVPTSSEYRREVLRAAAEVQASSGRPALPPVSRPAPVQQESVVVEGEIVDEAPSGEPAAYRAKEERRMFAVLGKVKVTQDDDRYAVYSALASRPIGSTTELTDAEVTLIADHLDGLTRQDEQTRADGIDGLLADGAKIRAGGAR